MEPIFDATFTPTFASVSPTEARLADEWYQAVLERAELRGFYSERVTLTPARALAILKFNADNRRITESKFQQLVSDIREGRWRFNGEAIIISKEGLVNDGQHRTLGVASSGVAIDTVLTAGVERDTRFTVDVGRTRTIAEMLGLQGYVNNDILAGATRIAMQYERSTVKGLARANGFSSPMVQERARDDKELHEAVSWAGVNRAKVYGLLYPSELAFIRYILMKTHPEKAEHFTEKLVTGSMLDDSDPILMVREKLRSGKRMTKLPRLEVVMRGWNYWVRDETPTRIHVTGTLPVLRGPKTKNAPATESVRAETAERVLEDA